MAESRSFQSIINQNVNPCDDFHQFACGKFLSDAEELHGVGENGVNHPTIDGNVEKGA